MSDVSPISSDERYSAWDDPCLYEERNGHEALPHFWILSESTNKSAIYHAALAKEMTDLGLDIDRVGKNGTFELAGISDKAITYFSARRHEIEKELAEAGTTSGSSAALASTVAKSTRHAKERDTDRETVWREMAQSAGLRVTDAEVQVLETYHDSFNFISETTIHNSKGRVTTQGPTSESARSDRINAGGITNMPSRRKRSAPTCSPSRRSATSHRIVASEPVTDRFGPRSTPIRIAAVT